jgi:hypothetical protein
MCIKIFQNHKTHQILKDQIHLEISFQKMIVRKGCPKLHLNSRLSDDLLNDNIILSILY